MNVLLHICCGPCSIFPLTQMTKDNIQVTGYFYNPNIHPFREFKRRIESTLEVADVFNVPVEVDRDYGLVEYLRKVVFHEDKRCPICYDMRLKQVAKMAAHKGFDSFSTTLLYSRYQDHQSIREKGDDWANHYGVDFYYQDFRGGWQYGVDRSIELGVYRQPYCGCIYSEQERYDNRLKKKLKKLHKSTK